MTVIDGDARCPSIAAASVIAKVARDRAMAELAVLYPAYGLENHKGYGTPEHARALTLHGPCPIHRRTFRPIREHARADRWRRRRRSGTMVSASRRLFCAATVTGCFTAITGRHGGEIDLVCRHGEVLVFVEVSTRATVDFGRPAETIDAGKEEALRHAARRYLELARPRGHQLPLRRGGGPAYRRPVKSGLHAACRISFRESGLDRKLRLSRV